VLRFQGGGEHLDELLGETELAFGDIPAGDGTTSAAARTSSPKNVAHEGSWEPRGVKLPDPPTAGAAGHCVGRHDEVDGDQVKPSCPAGAPFCLGRRGFDSPETPFLAWDTVVEGR
jgi:hypothetical protein